MTQQQPDDEDKNDEFHSETTSSSNLGNNYFNSLGGNLVFTTKINDPANKNFVTSSFTSQTFAIKAPSQPILDLDQKLHRLIVFILFFLLVLLTLAVMSKIYKTVNLLKYRNKHYGYYVNPKCETILISLNRRLKIGSLQLAQNLNRNLKRQFVRVRKVDDNDDDDNEKDDDFCEKQIPTQVESTDEDDAKMKSLRMNNFESGHINQVFELTEIDDVPDDYQTRFSSCDMIEDELEGVGRHQKRECIINLIKNGHLGVNFNYRRLGKVKSKKSWYKVKGSGGGGGICTRNWAKRAVSDYSYFVRKQLPRLLAHNNRNNKQRRTKKKNSTSSSTTSPSCYLENPPSCASTVRSVDFILPVILVTDTASMNTTIIDLEEEEF